jgi:hypothetical protein
MKYVVALVVAILLGFALAISSANPIAAPDTSTCVYIIETGHNIHGPFLAFFLSHNGVENFGVPLTEAFWEGAYIVQYFTGGRFELHPEESELYRVLLGLLGLEYGITDPPIKPQAIPPANNPNFRYFPDTGQMISLAIKDFFDARGGIDVFGYPISGLHYELGVFAQYFQRQRLEWTPAILGANRVRSSPVGQISLDRRYPLRFQWRAKATNDWCPARSINDPFLKSAPPKPTPTASAPRTPSPTTMNLRVRVRFSHTGPTGPQFVDVSVEDQNGNPVAGAGLYAVIHFANGDRVLPVNSSDASGKSAFQFDIGKQPAGSTTVVEVFAALGALHGVGRDSFTR